MSRDSHDSTYGSWSRIKASLNITTTSEEDVDLDSKQKTMLKKHRKRPSLLTALDSGNETQTAEEPSSAITSASASPNTTFPSSGRLRSSLSLRQTIKRSSTSHIASSLRSSTRLHTEKDDIHNGISGSEPLSAASTHAPSVSFGDALTDVPTTGKTVIVHGEVQTSASMFRKKKEYLVLTDHAITRFKNQMKAAETYTSIGHTVNNSRPIKHTPSQSYGSASDLQTVSDSSGDRTGRILLTDVVAVCILDDGKPYFTIEVSFLDEETGHASAVTLQFSNPQERENWITSLRKAVSEAHLREGHRIANYNIENAARLVERSNDYDPENCAIYKVVQRSSMIKTHARSSSDDISKVASTVGLLAIGVHKIHLIPLAKPVSRTSSPSLAASSSSPFVSSYGILTVSVIKVSNMDDSFELTLRKPLERAHTLHLASSAVYDIVTRLYHCENMLRPEAGHRFYRLSAPAEVNDMLPPSIESNGGEDDHNNFQRTLIAYCVAYGVDPTHVRYAIEYDCEDSPRFNLLQAAADRHTYNSLELLAVLRALRYNETFSSYSFSGIALDSLKGLHDNYGREFVCTRTKMGTIIRLSHDELAQADLLKQEVRALAVTNRKLRRMDFSGCISTKPKTATRSQLDESQDTARDPGCGIVEALLPLCRHQTTNVDWICLNGIELTDVDLDYLIGAAVDKACHFRALELNRCALDDRSLGLLLDALRAQENTLEAIELAGNAVRIEPSTFDSQLSVFGFIRKLDLSFVSRTSGPEPILQAETFAIWRLSDLRFSGTLLNPASVDALVAYLEGPRSQTLHELHLDNTQLSGADIALLLHAMCKDPVGGARQLHLDISGNNVCRDLEQLTHAISSSLTPSHLTMRAIEYREDSQFRKMLMALAVNETTSYLDISQTALPGDASSDTCRALGKLLSSNAALVDLNISGEDSRLASSMFGGGINDALAGLAFNKSLRTLHIERQRLGLHGANSLSEALRKNKTLQELYCGNNEIPLQGLTDLVNALIDNTSLVYLPNMDDGREIAFKTAEATMRTMQLDVPNRVASGGTKLRPLIAQSPIRKGLTSVRRSTQRTAVLHPPAFPALQSYAKSTSSSSPPPSPSPLNLPRSRQASDGTTAVPPTFTVQDIQTTHRLLNEQWDRQCFRLAQYLERNWCLLNNTPVPLAIEDEKFERPESAGSLAKMLETVKLETTPRAEKDLYFDASEQQQQQQQQQQHDPASISRSEANFQQFLLDSQPASPDEEEHM